MKKRGRLLCLLLNIIIIIGSIGLNNFIKVNANEITWNETQVNGRDTVTALKDTNAGFNYSKGHKLNVIRADGKYAFCIEPNVLLKDGKYSTTYLEPDDTPMRKAAIAKWIHFDRKKYGGSDYDRDVRDGFDYSIAQLLIWKIGGQPVDMSAWFDEHILRAYVDAGIYQIDEWDKWPEYVGKEFTVKRGEDLNLNSPCEGKYLYTDAADVKITYSDAPGYPTNTSDRYTSVINMYKQQYKIHVGNNAPKEFDVYVSQESDKMQSKMLASQSPIIYRSSESQDLISGGYIKPDVKKIRVKISDKSIKINKSSNDGKAIANVKFEISTDKEFKNIITTLTTGADGTAVLKEGLSEYDKVYIREIYVDKPFIKTDEVKEVILNDAEETIVNFVNAKIKGKIKIIKTHNRWSTGENLYESEEEEPEEGVEFDILDSLGKKVGELTTDKDGKAISNYLTFGEYHLVQKSQFPGTVKAEKVKINITENDKVYDIKIKNKNLKSKLKIQKVDEKGNILKLSGIKFNILSNGKAISINGKKEFVTNDDGEILIDSYLPFGNYAIKEVYVPDRNGYTISDEIKKFMIDGKEDLIEVKFGNKKQLGEVIISKVGASITSLDKVNKLGYEVVAPVIKDIPLAGVEFELEDSSGKKYHAKTDEKGLAKFSRLNIGNYILREVKTLEGFVLNKEPIDVKLTPAESNVKIVQKNMSLKNIKKKLQVELKKNIEGSEIHPQYKSIGFDNIIFGLYAKNDSKLYKADQLLDVSKLDDEFIAKFELYDDGEYYIKELKTGDMYVLDDSTKELNIRYKDIESTSTLMLESTNRLKKGNIRIIKKRLHDGQKLANIRFILCDKDGNKIAEYVTDEEGKICIDNLEYGEYIIKEEKNEGYLAIEDISVSISEDKQVLSYDVENEMIPSIRTEATVDGKKEINNAGNIVLTDRLYYKDIVPNKEYIVKSSLIDKNTEKILSIDGKEVTQNVKLISSKSEGYIDIKFNIDARKIGDKNVVVIEELYTDSELIAEHKELDNIDQTVYFRNPSIETYATINELKEFNGVGKVSIIDEVRYKNLYSGREYRLVGKLVDKETGIPISVDGKEVVSEIKFVPDENKNKVYLRFDIDVSNINAKNIVIFDNLYLDNELLFEHSDINNIDQTVKINKPGLPPTGVGKDIFKNIVLLIIGITGYILISKINRKQNRNKNKKL